jgi:hypothetical protein
MDENNNKWCDEVGSNASAGGSEVLDQILFMCGVLLASMHTDRPNRDDEVEEFSSRQR